MTLAENFEHIFKRAAFKGDFSYCTHGHPFFGRGHGGRGKFFRFETNAGSEHHGWTKKSKDGECYRLFYHIKRKMNCKHRRHRAWKRRFGGFSANMSLCYRDRFRFHFAESKKRAILFAVAVHHVWHQQASAPLDSAKHHVGSFCRSISLGMSRLLNRSTSSTTQFLLSSEKQIVGPRTIKSATEPVKSKAFNPYRCIPLPDLILRSSSAAFESARPPSKNVSDYVPSLLTVFKEQPTPEITSARSELSHSQTSLDDTLQGDTYFEDKFGDNLPLHVTSLAESAVVDFAMPPPFENASVSPSLGDQSPNGVLTQLRSYISRLQGVARDIESIATLGDLPFSIELNGSVLRVHFPNSDSQSLNYLLQDKEVTNGQVSEVTLDVEDIDEPVVPLLSYSLEDAGVSDSDPTPGLSFSDGSETFESSLSTVTESYYSIAEI